MLWFYACGSSVDGLREITFGIQDIPLLNKNCILSQINVGLIIINHNLKKFKVIFLSSSALLIMSLINLNLKNSTALLALICFTLLPSECTAKMFTRCQLAKELLRHDFPRSYLSNCKLFYKSLNISNVFPTIHRNTDRQISENMHPYCPSFRYVDNLSSKYIRYNS